MPLLQRNGAAAGDFDDLESLERPKGRQNERLRAGQLQDHGVGGVVHDRGVVELSDVEQLGVAIARRREL